MGTYIYYLQTFFFQGGAFSRKDSIDQPLKQGQKEGEWLEVNEVDWDPNYWINNDHSLWHTGRLLNQVCYWWNIFSLKCYTSLDEDHR